MIETDPATEISARPGGAAPVAAAGPDTAAEEGSVLAALAQTAFRRLWLAELLSQTALNAIWYAAIVATELETHSTTEISLTVVSATLPVAIFGVLAGILVDRWNKRQVLVWSNVLRIAISAGYLLYGWSIVVVFAMNFLINIVAQFFSPAMLATIPRLLPKRQLTAATGLFNITLNISQILGMVLLGPTLIKVVGPGIVFAVATGIYVVATILVALVPADHTPARETRPADERSPLGEVYAELREGWGFVRSDQQSWLAMVFLALTWTILFALITLAPRYAASRMGLRIESGDAIFVLAPAGLGMALAAGLLDRLHRHFGRWRLVGVALVGLALTLAVLASVAPLANWWVRNSFDTRAERIAFHQHILVPRVAIVGLVALIAGWWVGIVTVTSEAVLLERAPADLRGRIFAIQLTFTNLASVVPLLVVGGLADHIGLNQVILLTGVIVLGAWLFTMSPLVRHPRDEVESRE
ncbi:MAG: MFS transporter [Thermomicrobiales bacterium]